MASRILVRTLLRNREKAKTCASLTSINYSTNWEPKNPETHTGQQFADNDYRLARFIDKEKQVNPNFAVKLINSVPPQEKKARVVWCDGGGGPTGHPRVYINLDKPGNHTCGYCGLRFVKKDDHHH